MEVETLRYPKKSHRKVIEYPSESAQLAEFIGIVFGDGGIGNEWQVVVTMNSIADAEYSSYVANLGQSLFGVKAAIRKRENKNALLIVFSGMNMVDFLVSKGCVRGNKIAQGITAPDWIMRNIEYQKMFLRGLVDTDGCLYIHRHKVGGREYKNLGFCFSSYSPNLLKSAGIILENLGILPHFSKSYTNIFLYGKAVERYLEIFGSSNPRILNKYKAWLNGGV